MRDIAFSRPVDVYIYITGALVWLSAVILVIAVAIAAMAHVLSHLRIRWE